MEIQKSPVLPANPVLCARIKGFTVTSSQDLTEAAALGEGVRGTDSHCVVL